MKNSELQAAFGRKTDDALIAEYRKYLLLARTQDGSTRTKMKAAFDEFRAAFVLDEIARRMSARRTLNLPTGFDGFDPEN